MKEKINIFSKILTVFYPNRCLHCSDKIEKNFFCKNCLSFFNMVYPKKDVLYFGVFEKKGPIITLLKEIKKQNIYELIKLAASFMVVQISKLGWEEMDVIVPIGKKSFKKDHAYYLAKEVAILFDKPLSYDTNLDKTALFIDDVFKEEIVDEIKKEKRYKKSYYLSLCFDIFFDDLYLSK